MARRPHPIWFRPRTALAVLFLGALALAGAFGILAARSTDHATGDITDAPSTTTASTAVGAPTTDPTTSTTVASTRPGDVLPRSMPVAEAIDELERTNAYGPDTAATVDRLRRYADDPTFWLDERGRTFVIEEPTSGASNGTSTPSSTTLGGSTPQAIAPLDDTFTLHSRPGSDHTIFLDFDGAVVTNTAWNFKSKVATITAPAWDRDGDPTTFDAYERAFIQEVWSYVAEDYAPFDVDVTTETPTAAALERTDEADTTFGVTSVLTNEIVGGVCNDCGGVAYLEVFDVVANADAQPAWTFVHDSSAVYASQTVSHEVGHNFGLIHDGRTSTTQHAAEKYYGGQGIWSPIMGGGATNPIMAWSNGQYADADNNEDDLAIIAAHGAPAVADDVGDTIGDATSIDPSQPVVGEISTSSDVDVYGIAVPAGPLRLRVDPAIQGANLDIAIELMDADGNVIARSDPPSARAVTTTLGIVRDDISKGMAASIETTIPTATTVYLSVDGVGAGDPLVDGYDDYGSIGRYTISTAVPKLSITVHGTGTIAAVSPSISCTASCSIPTTLDSNVNLSPVFTSGWSLAYWIGPCEHTVYDFNPRSTCTIPMDQDRDVIAVFRPNRTINASATGPGSIFAKSTNTFFGFNLDCGSRGGVPVITCSSTNWRPIVTVEARPEAGDFFTGWTGACTGTDPTCDIAMDASTRTVGATFVEGRNLTITKVGEGSIASNPAGIACGATCTSSIADGTSVTLTATPSANKEFVGWSGDCSGTTTTCTTTMTADRSVTATFRAIPRALTVTTSGRGLVLSNPSGISCPSTCSANFDQGTTVTLTATPEPGTTAVFSGWSGACSGTTATCSVSMTDARSATATFVIPSAQVTIAITGSGRVTTPSPGLTCGPTSCSITATIGSALTFTAVPSPGSTFTGWANGCTGMTVCSVSVTGARSVTARFAVQSTIAAGTDVTCRLQGGGVKCWGLGSLGQIGNNGLASPVKVPTQVSGLSSGVAAITVGGRHACALLTGGTVKCWGSNAAGQLGTSASATPVKVPTAVPGLANVVMITAGDAHTCALLTDRTVMCWGSGANGRLGNGATTSSSTPVPVRAVDGAIGSLSGVISISAGTAHTCAVLADGTAACWGAGTYGRLGYQTVDRSTPARVRSTGGATGTNLSGITAISAGGEHTCAIVTGGAVRCWGRGLDGRLGNNALTDSAIAVNVLQTSTTALSGATSIDAGGAHTCAIVTGGAVRCWGSGTNGRLGTATTTSSKLAIVTSPGLSSTTQLTSGTSHSCAVANVSGVLTTRCWGAGANGQLGNGLTADKTSPTATTG